MLGAERADLTAVLASMQPGPISTLATSVAEEGTSAGAKLLKWAAIDSVCVKSGFKPAHHSGLTDSIALHETEEAAPSEKLAEVLAIDSARLHQEVFALMKQDKLRVPAFKLRSVLDMGSTHVGLRPMIIPLLGEKGRWLAKQHDSWAWARSTGQGSSHDEKWKFGSLQERVEALMAFRFVDPAAARERLMLEMSTFAPAERATLISALRAGLSLDDEKDLNKLLLDRAKEPRQAAAALLSTLPDSAYGRRAQQRMAALLTKDPVSRSWKFEAPKKFDPEWEKDEIVLERPKSFAHLGEKAWWLQQLVSVTHPAWFSEHTRLMPDELVKLAAASEWSDALVVGWAHALKMMPTPQWASALIDVITTKHSIDREHLRGMLTQAEFESKWLQEIAASDKSIATVARLIESTPMGRTWSEKLSSAALDLLLRCGRQGDYSTESWRIGLVFKDLVSLVHPLSAARTYERLHQEAALAHASDPSRIHAISAVRARLSTWLPIHP